MKLPFGLHSDENKIEIKTPGKTYNFSKEEREAIEQNQAVINIHMKSVKALANEVKRIEMVAKDRVGVDPYTHVQIDYDKWTFFVPEVKPKVQPSLEVGKEENEIK